MPKKCATDEQRFIDDVNHIRSSNKNRGKKEYLKILSQPLNVKQTTQADVRAIGREIAAIENEIIALKTDASGKPKKRIPSATKSIIRQKISLKKSKEKLKESLIKDASKYKEKMNALKNLEKIVLDQFNLYSTHHLYQSNPVTSFTSLKEWAKRELRGEPFNTFDELDIGQLNVLEYKLQRYYKQMNSRIEKGLKLGWRAEQLYDPGAVLFEHDPTGAGYLIINDLKNMPDKIFSKVNQFQDKIANEQAKFNDLIQFMTSEAKLDPPEEKNFYNQATGQVFEILDEQIMYFEPKPMFKWVDDKIEWLINNEQKQAIKEIYDKNKANGLQARGDIKTRRIGGQERIFFPVKQVRDDNREVYDAFELPYKLSNAGIKILTNPLDVNELKKFFEGEYKDIRIANYTSRTGQQIKGGMQSSYYKANKQNHDVANYEKKNEKVIRSYQKYEPIELMSLDIKGENQSIDSEELWSSISGLRKAFLGLYQESTEQIEIFNDNLKLSIEKIYQEFKKRGKTLNLRKGFTKNTIKTMIKEIGNLQGMNANINVKDGEIQGATVFNQRLNYFPHMYYDADYLRNLMSGFDDIDSKVEGFKRELEAAKTAGDKKKVKILKDRINSAYETKKDTLLRIDIMTGQANYKDLDITDDDGKINIVQNSVHSQSRTGWMDPITRYSPDSKAVINRGIKKTWNVPNEYARNMYTDIEQKKIVLKVMNALINMDSVIGEKLIDQVKSGFGDPNTSAGFLGIDYSDERLENIINKTINSIPGRRGKKVNMKDITANVNFNSSLISAALLRNGAPITNNFQVFNLVTKNGIDHSLKAFNYYKSDETRAIVEKAAQNAGVTDVIVALADALTQLTGDEYTFGASAFLDLFLLKLDKMSFLDKVEDSAIGNWISNRIEALPEEVKVAAGTKKDIASGLWDMFQVLSTEKNGTKRKKAIVKHLGKIVSKEQLDRYVGFSLKGAYLGKLPKIGTYLSMTGTEVALRTLAFSEGALARWEYMDHDRWHNRVDKDQTWLEWILSQDDAIEAGRMSVQLTMYGISPGFLSPMFKGSLGKILTKFKPFAWHQYREEWKYIENFLAVHNDINDPKIKKILNSTYEGAKLSLLKGLPFRDLGNLSKPERQFRDFIMWRGTISVIGFLLGFNGIMPSILKSFMYKSGNYRVSNALLRGGESIIITSFLEMIRLAAAAAGFGGEDNEELYDESFDKFMWMFSPMIINLAYQAYQAEDPWEAASTVARIYAQPLYWIGDAIGSVLPEDDW